mmetsp:Transcript_13666/g.27946  ORF Transcript_13666/g.27946 Transcript_13666/m.27946 type:complete len:378 (+) Transcript_13666:182-1315(+)
MVKNEAQPESYTADVSEHAAKKLKTENDESSTTSSKPPSKSLVTQMSFDAIVNPLVSQHTLVLGTFPSEKSQNYHDQLVVDKTRQLLKKRKADSLSSLPKEAQEKVLEDVRLYVEMEIFKRGGDSQMNYGNFKNPFWNIAGVACNFTRERTTYEEKKQMFTSAGYCLWDVCMSITKKAGSSLDNDIKSSEPNDIIGLLNAYPTIKKIVFPRTSALFFIEHFKNLLTADPELSPPFSFYVCNDDIGADARKEFVKETFRNVKKVPRSDLPESSSSRRIIELVIVPSTSPAHCRKGATPPFKEKKWLIACYGWSPLKPKEDYKCACCGAMGAHYTVDCDIYQDDDKRKEWKEHRKKLNKEQAKDPRKIKELWDCENWYI